jgi:hypothetical protein
LQLIIFVFLRVQLASINELVSPVFLVVVHNLLNQCFKSFLLLLFLLVSNNADLNQTLLAKFGASRVDTSKLDTKGFISFLRVALFVDHIVSRKDLNINVSFNDIMVELNLTL